MGKYVLYSILYTVVDTHMHIYIRIYTSDIRIYLDARRLAVKKTRTRVAFNDRCRSML